MFISDALSAHRGEA